MTKVPMRGAARIDFFGVAPSSSPSRRGIMGPPSGQSIRGKVESWIGLTVCAGVFVGWAMQQLVPNDPDGVPAAFAAPGWLPLAAAGFAAAGVAPLAGSRLWLRAREAVRWAGLLLMVWAASGLPFDLLTAAGLIGHRTASGEIVMSTVYWPALVTRAFALAAVVVLARLALARPDAAASGRPAAWYGLAAFVFALPYPVLRVHWALGGTIGLKSAGAAGVGWEPLLIAIPWALAAVLSLFLVSPPRRMPRRLLLLGGWSATAIVAMIGPAAFWGFASALASGADMATGDIEIWVFGLFYTSWFLWAIAGGAATRAYQLRSATLPTASPMGLKTYAPNKWRLGLFGDPRDKAPGHALRRWQGDREAGDDASPV